MARILTAAVLIPLVILLLFLAPFWAVTLAAAVVAMLACWEYLGLADGSGAQTPRTLVLDTPWRRSSRLAIIAPDC